MDHDPFVLNPAFVNFTKLYVPYCSSEKHPGNWDKAPETGNFFIVGINIVSAEVDDVYWKGIVGGSGSNSKSALLS